MLRNTAKEVLVVHFVYPALPGFYINFSKSYELSFVFVVVFVFL